jgi:replicative DNA helicase
MARQLLHAANEITETIRSGEKSSREMLDFAENKIYEIRSQKEIRGLVHIKPTAIEVMKELSELSENPDAVRGKGLSTSFSGLDEYIFGLNPTDMILVAGRPGMGKTTFAINIAVNVSKKYSGKKIVIFSLEMSKEQIVKKIISAEAKITSEKMRTGRLDKSEWQRIGESIDILSSTDIYIDDTANVTVGEMKAKLRRVKDLGLVVIDYLQLMSTGRRDGNRVTEISEITRNLKIMAKELNVPVIVASQLSRSPESRADKRPVLSDLRESGSIEQDADIVIFLYRDVYYNKETEYVNAAECIISKNRHGETAVVGLNFEGNYSRFTTTDYVHAGDN